MIALNQVKNGVMARLWVSRVLGMSQPHLGLPMSRGASSKEGLAHTWKAPIYFVMFSRVGVSLLNAFLFAPEKT